MQTYDKKALPVERSIHRDFRLKLLHESDAQKIFDTVQANRDYLNVWLPWVEYTRNVLDTTAFIQDMLIKYQRGENLPLGIWHEDEFAGSIGFNEVNKVHRRATIGYWLAASHQNKGVMTEACRALMEYAFNELQINRIEIHCAAKNYKSRAVPQRLNFQKEGVLRDYHLLHNEFTDIVIYSILRKEWK